MAAYIALRYTNRMAGQITSAEYLALAELRYRIRKFVGEGDAVARQAGLEPQQYLLLLMIRGLPSGEEATIRTLAERLALKHHSVVELVDRMEHTGMCDGRGAVTIAAVCWSRCCRGASECWKMWCANVSKKFDRMDAALVSAIDQLLDRPQKAPSAAMC